MVFQHAVEGFHKVKLPVNTVVFIRLKLFSPTIKTEIQQMRSHARLQVFCHGKQCYGCNVSCPRVVIAALAKDYSLELLCFQMPCKQFLHFFYVLCHYQQLLVPCYNISEFKISCCYFLQIGLPICFFMWPNQHNATLFFPLCRKFESIFVQCIHLCIKVIYLQPDHHLFL